MSTKHVSQPSKEPDQTLADGAVSAASQALAEGAGSGAGAQTAQRLVSPKRAKEINKACRRIIEAVCSACEKYRLQAYCSIDGNFIEIVDPETVLPDGYEYVAIINLDEDSQSYEICERLPDE